MIHHCNYENKSVDQILKNFTEKQRMSFNLYCAKEVEHLADNPTIIDCNQKIKLWLDGDTSIDLEEISNIAYNIAINALNNGNLVAYYASLASSSSYSSSYSYYYYYSSYYHASKAKVYNLHPNNESNRNIAYKQFQQEYFQIAQNWLSYWRIPNFPTELDFPIFDFLQDYNLIQYLLPKQGDVYYLNLNGFDIKHQNESELLKMVNTDLVKSVLRRIINNSDSLFV